MLRALAVLALLPFAIPLATPVQAQSQPYLTRAEVEAHMRAAVFCYYPDDRFSCSWAELYTEFHAESTILYTAEVSYDFPMSVSEYQLDWQGDALCIPYETQGLRSMWEAYGYRFPFDLAGLTPLSSELLPARIVELRDVSPESFCFQYSNDPDTPGQLLQHVFRDGVQDAEQDPVALIPLFASCVAMRPN